MNVSRVLNNYSLVDFGEKIIQSKSGIYIDYTEDRTEYQPKRAVVVKSSDKELKEGDEIFISYLACLEAEEDGLLIVNNPVTKEKRGFLKNFNIKAVLRDGQLHAYGDSVLAKPIIEEKKHDFLDLSFANKESEQLCSVFGKNKFYDENEIIHFMMYGNVPLEFDLTRTTEKLFTVDKNMIWGWGENPKVNEGFIMVKKVEEDHKGIIIYEAKKNLVPAKVIQSPTDKFYEGQVVYIPRDTIHGKYKDCIVIYQEDVILV